MKIEPFLIPVSVNLMMAQRLVGALCPHCKTAGEASPPMQQAVKKALADLPQDIKSQFPEPYRVYRAPGCPKCKDRGVVGRTALFEVFRMSPELEEIINTGPTVQKIFKEAKRQGMITLRQDGVLKALQGKVSLEEVMRETEEL